MNLHNKKIKDAFDFKKFKSSVEIAKVEGFFNQKERRIIGQKIINLHLGPLYIHPYLSKGITIISRDNSEKSYAAEDGTARLATSVTFCRDLQ